MSTAGSSRRIAFYSHDTQGLGHIRRNIELAAALVEADGGTDVLLITGAPEATALDLPPRTEVLALPTVGKDSDGGYAAGAFGLALSEVLRLRSRVIWAAIRSFAPDLLVVDKVARGLGGELDRTLRKLARSTRHRTQVVLGLRDVLDAPTVARREWREQGATAAVLGYYDQVWVYGDPAVYDPIAECGLPVGVAQRARFTGYLASGRGRGLHRAEAAEVNAAPVPPGNYVLCMVGGGQDGAELARSFVRSPLPLGHLGVLVSGPYLPPAARAEIERIAAERVEMTVYSFVPNTQELIDGARAVITMGGYNTVCEALSGSAPALVVPRERPRAEQLVRAERLHAIGALDMLPADDADPVGLGRWLATAVDRPPQPRRRIDLDGLRAVPTLAQSLLNRPELLDVLA
ncbi:glycosyltransferase family protein [Ruania alba]|uniref:Predicted glycosyl transferase n=1 Tax=Ruania alba TaxID=648782 RepID=A0A1H5N1X2_9MICO|nr:glycosyltransferase [Ruania alba]SEE95440.1 Predicted glycosyl transferase [Ruania alba]